MINQDAIAAKATVGTVTAGFGLVSYLDQIQTGLSIVLVIMGIIVNAVFLYKEYESRRAAKKENPIKRRATDKGGTNG